MILYVYAVHDDKAGAFLSPFFVARDAMAIRMFSDAVNDPNTMFAKHPKDFTLFRLARYDDNTGEFVNEEKCNLGMASDFLRVPGSLPLLQERG